MILHSIELSYVGRFRETIRLGPFAAGLNIFSAPNEFGKSTAIRAAARTLFDRHTTKGDELKALQPAGTELAPRIAVEFETRAGRFRVEKTFLQSPRSLLRHWQSGAWQPVAEADAADQRVQDLLHSTLPGKGATKPEHWGFLSFLWARQGEPMEWPGLEDAAVGQPIRARLARVELDPVIEELRSRLAAAADVIFTSKGLPRTNGPLDLAEKDLAEIESALGVVRETRLALESSRLRHEQAVAGVIQLEKEHAERERAATTIREQAQAFERLRGELDARQRALLTAQEKLMAVAADAETLVKRQSELATAQGALAQAEATAKTADRQLAQLRIYLDEQHAARRKHESQLNTLRADLRRLQSLLKLRQLVVTAADLARQGSRSQSAASDVDFLAGKKAQLPAIAPAMLRTLEERADQVRILRAQVQALGLTVELTPDHDSSATWGESETANRKSYLALRAGQTERLQRADSVDLQLAGWGRVLIRSGAQDAQHAAVRLTQAETALREALQGAEISSVDAARAALAVRQDLEIQIKAAAAILATQLGEHKTIADLHATLGSAHRRVETLAAALEPTAEEQAHSHVDLETDEARLAAAVPAGEKVLKAFDPTIDQLRADERAAAQSVQDATQFAHQQGARLSTLETQIADLAHRYPDGIAAAKSAAQLAFAQAEARVVATRAGLPPDFEKLPERNKRAASALQHLANELQSRRAERDHARGTLETLGGQGLYSRETELEERKSEAVARRDAARAQGWSARIANQLIDHRKQAATKAVLRPLEQRLTAAFAELTGNNAREVFLDERLQIGGIGRTREETYPFESLSQGAKEQLLLCLRIAVAQELAVDEPQILILDDVLVNTDSVRQERILDVLGSLSTKLQVLVLTCHPDRYRGVGHAISLPP